MTDHSVEADLVRVERRETIAIVQINHPKANVLSTEVLSLLVEAISGLEVDPPGAVVIWGGERIFAAGADIFELMDERAGALLDAFRRAFDALAGLSRATIAAVCGVALGGGCELALACDFRVVSATAKFGFPEVQLGVFPGAGGTQRLPRLIGAARAKELMMSGRQVDADEAMRIGLADRVVAPEAVLDEAIGWATTLASGARLAQGLLKRAIDQGLDRALCDGLDLERQLFDDVLSTNDAKVGMHSFVENGPGKATFDAT